MDVDECSGVYRRSAEGVGILNDLYSKLDDSNEMLS